MAGKLKSGEMKDVLLRLNTINNSCDSAVATLLQRQIELSRALETQKYLNKSVVPLYTALVPQEDHVRPQSGEHP